MSQRFLNLESLTVYLFGNKYTAVAAASLKILVIPIMQVLLCVVIASLFKMAMHVPRVQPKLEEEGEEREPEETVHEPTKEEEVAKGEKTSSPASLFVKTALEVKAQGQGEEEEISVEDVSVEEKAKEGGAKDKKRASLDSRLTLEEQTMLEEFFVKEEEKKKAKPKNPILCCFGG